MQLEPELLDGAQHGRLLRVPCGDDCASDRDRLDLPLHQLLDKSGGRRRGDSFLATRGRIQDHAAILGHDPVEEMQLREYASKIRYLAPGHEHEPTTRRFELLQRLKGAWLDRTVMSERPIKIRSKGKKEHSLLRAKVRLALPVYRQQVTGDRLLVVGGGCTEVADADVQTVELWSYYRSCPASSPASGRRL